MDVNEKAPQEQPAIVERTTSDLVKAAMSGWLGTALEFMDFQLYSLAAALVFKDIFFPPGDPAIAIMSAMAVYGVGYLARPVGAWYFGRMGDRIGRVKVLFITIAMMGAATTLIGALPTYDTVGVLAPILLVVLRLVQGFGAGAEIAGSAVMLAEYAPNKRRGIISSLVAIGTNTGTLGAAAIWAILLTTLGEDDVIAWGWRIPFLASFVLMGLAIFIRLKLKETPVFEASQEEDLVSAYDAPLPKKAPKIHDPEADVALRVEATAHPEGPAKKSVKAFLVASMLRFGQSGNSGMVQTYLITFITANLLVSKTVASNVVVFSSLVGFLTVPLIGWLGDRFGRKRMYTIVSSIGLVIIIPCFLALVNNLGTQTTPEHVGDTLVDHFSSPALMFFIAYIVLHNVTVLAFFSLENITMAECFGSGHRYEQLALSKEIPNMITAGFGPLAAAALVAVFHSWIALVVLMFIYTGAVLVTSLVMPEVANRDLTDPKDAM